MKIHQQSDHSIRRLPCFKLLEDQGNAGLFPNTDSPGIVQLEWAKRRVGKRVRAGLASAMVVFALLGAGCATTKTAGFSPQMTAPTPVALCPGDSLKISFPGLPELDQVQKVRVDGTVTMPMIGEAVAAGKTLKQFQDELVVRYKPQLQNSDVIVTLESGGISVYVSGAVKYPGKLVLGRPTTVIQGLMEAGGPNEFADIGKVHLVRLSEGRQHTQIFNLKSTMQGESTNAFYLKDGDMIHVPQSFF